MVHHLHSLAPLSVFSFLSGCFQAQGKGKVNRCPEVIINWQQRHENEPPDTSLMVEGDGVP